MDRSSSKVRGCFGLEKESQIKRVSLTRQICSTFVEGIWLIKDSQSHILASTFRKKPQVVLCSLGRGFEVHLFAPHGGGSRQTLLKTLGGTWFGFERDSVSLYLTLSFLYVSLCLSLSIFLHINLSLSFSASLCRSASLSASHLRAPPEGGWRQPTPPHHPRLPTSPPIQGSKLRT